MLHRMDNKARGKITHSGIGNDDEARIESIFERLNRAWPSFVRNNLRVLRLPSNVLEVVRDGKLEYTKAILIARIKDDAKRAELLAEVLEQNLSKHQIAQRLKALEIKEPAKPETKHLEQELSRLMGTKVRLTGTDRGELRVKFSSSEELNRVLELVGYTR